MALFKPLLGNSSSLDNIEKHAGYVYFCVDDGSLHFDYLDNDNNLQRKQINAQEAEKITGYDIATIIKSSDLEIPTSKAVLDALSLKQDVITGVEGQYVGFDSDGNTAAFDLPSEVIISDTEPTDETAEIWINTSEEWNDNIAGGGVSSWNDLTDKPFDANNIIKPEALPEGYPYKEQVQVNEPLNIRWDGNVDGKTPVGSVFYKVSDTVLTDEALKAATAVLKTSAEEIPFNLADSWDASVNAGLITEGYSGVVGGSTPLLLVVRDVALASAVDPSISETGVYFVNIGGDAYVSSLTTTEPVEYKKDVAHPMSVEYMPKMVVNVTHERDAELQPIKFKADKTYAEIRAAADAGYIVEMHMHWFSDTGADGPLQVLHYAGHYDMVGYPNQPLGFNSLWPLNHYNTSGVDGFRAILKCRESEDGEDTLDCKHFQFDVTWD